MPTVEASVVVPLQPDEVWHLMYGDDMAHVTKLTDTITDVRGYRMREDGTPIYRMFHKQGPMTFSEVSDYYVFDPPHRSRRLSGCWTITTAGTATRVATVRARLKAGLLDVGACAGHRRFVLVHGSG